jgi:uncharacterized protein YndB with AHSA1/START domain
VHEAVVEATLDAPPAEVWAALTEPSRLAAWFWPWQPRISFSPSEGAAYSIEAEHPASGALAVDGRILAAEPEERLAFTWRWTDEPGPTTEVDIRLGELGDGTQIVVRHRRIELESTADDFRVAWTDLITRLAEYVEREAQ